MTAVVIVIDHKIVLYFEADRAMTLVQFLQLIKLASGHSVTGGRGNVR